MSPDKQHALSPDRWLVRNCPRSMKLTLQTLKPETLKPKAGNQNETLMAPVLSPYVGVSEN